MYQKDYILRIIEQLGRLIAGILGLIKKGEYNTAGEQLENLYYELLQQDASFFMAIPEMELTQKLLREHNYTNGHLEILAELFNVEAELRLVKGATQECLEYSGKSLTLFEFIDAGYKTYSPDRLNKMEKIRERIKKMTGNC
jgi:hypothetical protein